MNDEYAPKLRQKKESLSWEDFLAWKHSYDITMGNGFTANTTISQNRASPDKDEGGSGDKDSRGLGPVQRPGPDDKPLQGPGAESNAGYSDPRDISRDLVDLEPRPPKKRRAARKHLSYSNNNSAH